MVEAPGAAVAAPVAAEEVRSGLLAVADGVCRIIRLLLDGDLVHLEEDFGRFVVTIIMARAIVQHMSGMYRRRSLF